MAPCVTLYVSAVMLAIWNTVDVMAVPIAEFMDENGRETILEYLASKQQLEGNGRVQYLNPAEQEPEKNHFHRIDIAHLVDSPKIYTDLERELTDYVPLRTLTDVYTDADDTRHFDPIFSETDLDTSIKDNDMAIREQFLSATDRDAKLISKGLNGKTAESDTLLDRKMAGTEIDRLMIYREISEILAAIAAITAGKIDRKLPGIGSRNSQDSRTVTDEEENIDGASKSIIDQNEDGNEDLLRMENLNLFDKVPEESRATEDFIREVVDQQVADLGVAKRNLQDCDLTRITYNMLLQYLKTGDLCGGRSVRFRFGIGK